MLPYVFPVSFDKFPRAHVEYLSKGGSVKGTCWCISNLSLTWIGKSVEHQALQKNIKSKQICKNWFDSKTIII